MLGAVIKEGHLAGREMIDPFMTKEVIVESFAYLVQVFHRNKDIFNFGKQPWLSSYYSILECPLNTLTLVEPRDVDKLVGIHSFLPID